MKLNIESTSKVVTLNGVPARIWEGTTGKGVPVHCYVTRVAVALEEDASEFQQDLRAHTAPSPEVDEIPLRLVL